MARNLLFVAVLALSACVLRPRYADLVQSTTTGPEALFVLVDKNTQAPLPNLRIEMSELKNRYIVTTKADGTFALPVDAKYALENPIVVVNLPPEVLAYDIKPAPVVPAPAPVTP